MYAVQATALQIFITAGFSATVADVAMNTAYSYTVGFAIEEQAMYPRPGAPDENYAPERRLARINATAAPTVAELATADRKRATDEYFDTGVSIVIAGTESLLARQKSGS